MLIYTNCDIAHLRIINLNIDMVDLSNSVPVVPGEEAP